MAYVNKLDNLGYWGEGSVNWVLDQVKSGQDFWKEHGSDLIEAGTSINNAMRNISPDNPQIFDVSGLSYVARVKAKKLNLRQSPNNSGQILGQLGQHQMVKVLGNVPNVPWAYITEPHEGYISNKKQYLQHIANTEDPVSNARKTSDKQKGSVSKGSIDPLAMLQGDAGSALLVGGIAVGLVLVLMSRK